MSLIFSGMSNFVKEWKPALSIIIIFNSVGRCLEKANKYS